MANEPIILNVYDMVSRSGNVNVFLLFLLSIILPGHNAKARYKNAILIPRWLSAPVQ